MSHDQERTEDANSTYITIEHEDDAQVSTFVESNNDNEQKSCQPVESVVCPSSKIDDNANKDKIVRKPSHTTPEPVNSEQLALRLVALAEEERQRQQLNSSSSDRYNEHNQNEEEPLLEYQIGYPITRFTRKWKRPEVQGFCCLLVEIICLATLAVVGLRALGYFNTLKDDEHLPLTYSWKLLFEFFVNAALPKELMECLFSNSGGKTVLREEDNYAGLEPMGSIEFNYGLLDAFVSHKHYIKPDVIPQDQDQETQIFTPPPNNSVHRSVCEFRPVWHSWGWLVKFFMGTNFMSVLNVITSSILYASLAVRRRKGMQVLLLLPSFFCFFVSIFQQMPQTMQYNYVDQALSKQMLLSISSSKIPYVVPILDETQLHRQCCGTVSPQTWDGRGGYPSSCCNTTAFNCSKLVGIKREHAWSIGCYNIEYKIIRRFQGWALFLNILKIIAEVGIFCTLSDLTRFDYPLPEATETSRCEFRDYQIKSRGVMHIKGVTKNGRVVVESKYWFPWRLVSSRTDMINGVQLNIKTDQNRTKGSVEIVKRQNAENFLNEDIQIDLTRKDRGIFVFTLL